MKAVTDSGPTKPNSPVGSVNNLFTIMDVVSDSKTVKFFRESYANCTIRYGDLKQLAEDIIKFTTPIYERMQELSSNEDMLKDS